MKLPRFILILIFSSLTLTSCTSTALNQPSTVAITPGVVHYHADIALYIHNNQFDFGDDKYQSTADGEKSPAIHFHDNVSHVVHKHYNPATLGDLFSSLKMEISSGCLTLDNNEKYCTDDQNSLKVFINKQPITNYSEYNLADLDQILISYGPHDDPNIETQLASISDDACIYSETCPERGAPPTENCIGSLPCVMPGNHSHD